MFYLLHNSSILAASTMEVFLLGGVVLLAKHSTKQFTDITINLAID